MAPCRCMHLIDYQRVAAFSRGWGLSPSYCHVSDSLAKPQRTQSCAQQITDNAYSFFDKNKKTPCSDDFSLAKPQRTQRLRAANHGQRVFLSNKNNKNPCRDARGSPSVSFWYRRASKQASASRHREETAFVPQACITARKTIKTADAAGIAVPAYDPYLHHTATSCKDNTCNTLIINMLLHSSAVGVGFIPILPATGQLP